MSSQTSEPAAAPELGLPDLSDTGGGSGTAAALREDQIQNAVAFLSHPKVRGSAVSAKRSFLEKKGLTAAEIDEAFNRVPEAVAAAPAAAAAPTPAAPVSTSSTPSYATNNLVTYTQPVHGAQPAAAHQSGSGMVASALVPMGPGHLQQLPPPQQQQQPLKWTHVVLGLGVAAASLYGLHQLLAPRITAWSHQLFAARREAQEAEAARTAALTAALDKLAAGQERLQEALDGMSTAMQQQSQQAASRYAASAQPEYLHCQSPSFALGSQQQYAPSGYNSSMYGGEAASSRAGAVRGWDAAESGSYYRTGGGGGGGGGPRAASQRAVAPGAGASCSPPDGFEVVPRSPAAYAGDNFSSISGPGSVRGYSGPADAARGGTSSIVGPAASSRPGTGGQQQQQQASVAGRPDEAPHSSAFQEVMEMVKAGITPPNVRTDIDDNPPDPSRPLTAPRLQPMGKPWERLSAIPNDIRTDPSLHDPPVGRTYAYHKQQQPQQQQQAAVGASGITAVAGTANGYYDNWSAASHDGSWGNTSSMSMQQQQHSSDGLGVMTAMESSAAANQEGARKAAGYDLTGLLGQDAGSSSAPWRPPPPPAATVTRPASSGGSSAQASVAAAAASTVVEAAVVQSTYSSATVDVLPADPQTDDIVAGLAAQMVQNVVASAAAEVASA